MRLNQQARLIEADEIDPFPTFRQYWSDPAFRAQVATEETAQRATANAAIDRGMAPLNQRQRERWAAEDLA